MIACDCRYCESAIELVAQVDSTQLKTDEGRQLKDEEDSEKEPEGESARRKTVGRIDILHVAVKGYDALG